MLIRKMLLGLLRAYQWLISPILGPRCRFYPTCSDYAYQAIEHYGIFKGSYLALRRILKCHPWHQGGYDPVIATSKAAANKAERSLDRDEYRDKARDKTRDKARDEIGAHNLSK